MRDAVRVALLARPGAGADRLREALRAAGADLVLEADPTTLEPAALSAAGPESVVVLLDAVVEDALDRLDPVLHDPAIDVLYEESEVAAAREGWDAARWTRHLSAKLMRHGDVLPPGREADAAVAPRAAPPPVAATPAAAAPRPADPAPAPPAAPAPSPAPAPSMFDPVAAEYDPPQADPGLPVGDLGLELDMPDLPEAPAVEPSPRGQEPVAELEPVPEPEPEAEPEAEPDWSSLTLSLEGDVPAPPPAAPPAPPAPPTAGSAPPASPEAPPEAPPARSDALRDFRRDLASIEQRIASMGLVEDAQPAPEPTPADTPALDLEPAPPTHVPDPVDIDTPAIPEPATAEPRAVPASSGPPGAVLVFAGIGGPDAVRQFLGALPDAFPRPVLIHQRLDGGRHDRLVQQMARATSLPVHLAADGDVVVPGHVYILPPGLRLAGDASGLRFGAGDDPMATLPPAGSAVLMFSGSDTSLVDAAMDHAQAGALVAGQSPEDCYDAAAADALVARGAESGQPAELARRLAGRWAA